MSIEWDPQAELSKILDGLFNGKTFNLILDPSA